MERRPSISCMDFVGDLHGIAVRLPVDAEQHGGLSVRGDHRVDRRRRKARRCRRRGCEPARRSTFLMTMSPISSGVLHLRSDQPQKELVIAAQQAGRIDQIRMIDRVQNVLHAPRARAASCAGSGRDLKFRLLPSLHEDGGDAVQPVQARLDVVGRQFPQLRLRNFVGRQAVAENRETREIQAVRFDLRRGRKRALNARDRGIDQLERLRPCPRSS